MKEEKRDIVFERDPWATSAGTPCAAAEPAFGTSQRHRTDVAASTEPRLMYEIVYALDVTP